MLVGHSLAEVGIAKALRSEPTFIQQLILVAALVLKPGERGIDRIPENRRSSYFELADASTDGSFTLSPEVTRRVFFNDLNDAQAQGFHAQLTPQPLSVYLEENVFDLSQFPCPKNYLACNRDQCIGLENSLLYAERLGGATTILNADHSVMLSAPKLLAHSLINKLAK